jgi:SpoVK/Ycf46/Vps4 family AAA+-type ATPase
MVNQWVASFYGNLALVKLFLSKAIANEAQCTFLEVSTTQIDDKYHGESVANVEAIFHLARILQPTIIFIDEIESILPDRSNSSAVNSAKVMLKFMTEMQGNAGQQVFDIGCTNTLKEWMLLLEGDFKSLFMSNSQMQNHSQR